MNKTREENEEKEKAMLDQKEKATTWQDNHSGRTQVTSS